MLCTQIKLIKYIYACTECNDWDKIGLSGWCYLGPFGWGMQEVLQGLGLLDLIGSFLLLQEILI